MSIILKSYLSYYLKKFKKNEEVYLEKKDLNNIKFIYSYKEKILGYEHYSNLKPIYFNCENTLVYGDEQVKKNTLKIILKQILDEQNFAIYISKSENYINPFSGIKKDVHIDFNQKKADIKLDLFNDLSLKDIKNIIGHENSHQKIIHEYFSFLKEKKFKINLSNILSFFSLPFLISKEEIMVKKYLKEIKFDKEITNEVLNNHHTYCQETLKKLLFYKDLTLKGFFGDKTSLKEIINNKNFCHFQYPFDLEEEKLSYLSQIININIKCAISLNLKKNQQFLGWCCYEDIKDQKYLSELISETSNNCTGFILGTNNEIEPQETSIAAYCKNYLFLKNSTKKINICEEVKNNLFKISDQMNIDLLIKEDLFKNLNVNKGILYMEKNIHEQKSNILPIVMRH